VIAALGGAGNIRKVESAAETRLRVVVADVSPVDDAALTAAGIGGMVEVGDGTLHLLAGLNADQYAAEMRGQLASSRDTALASERPPVGAPRLRPGRHGRAQPVRDDVHRAVHARVQGAHVGEGPGGVEGVAEAALDLDVALEALALHVVGGPADPLPTDLRAGLHDDLGRHEDVVVDLDDRRRDRRTEVVGEVGAGGRRVGRAADGEQQETQRQRCAGGHERTRDKGTHLRERERGRERASGERSGAGRRRAGSAGCVASGTAAGQRPWPSPRTGGVAVDDRVVERPDALHLDPDGLAGRSGPTPAGVPVRTTSLGSRVMTCEISLTQGGDVDQQVGGGAVLAELAVDEAADPQVARVEPRRDRGAERTEGVEALRPEPLRLAPLPVPGGDVVRGGVAEHPGHRLLRGDPLEQRADHHGELRLVVDLVAHVGRQPDRIAGTDHRRGRLEEQQRLVGDLAAHLVGVRPVVLADAHDLGRDHRARAAGGPPAARAPPSTGGRRTGGGR
jgi:phosphotransferase system IIB component